MANDDEYVTMKLIVVWEGMLMGKSFFDFNRQWLETHTLRELLMHAVADFDSDLNICVCRDHAGARHRSRAAAMAGSRSGTEASEATDEYHSAEDLESPMLSCESSERPHRHRVLGLLPLVALIFYEVSGGPFGIEDAVSAGGPLLAILGFAILPFVWSLPEALITAELATAFPENSGYVAWVTEAFGPFWGFMEGLFSWISGVTDNAIYPVMFLTYLDAAWPEANLMEYKKSFLISLSMFLTFLNWRGLTLVGSLALFFTGIIVVPFVLMIIIGAPQVDVSNWAVVDWEAVNWSEFINVMFWNLNYWDSVSTLAGEVADPGKTFPRALAGGVVLVVAMYLLPLLVGLGVTTDPGQWTLGYFAKVADQVAGKWLVVLMVIAAAVSQLGQYQAEMSSDSYQLLGMSERGMLPKILSRRSRHGTPTLGLLLSSLGVLIMISFEFMQIVEMLNVVYCLAELLEFMAFIRLRHKHPHLQRPFRVPLPTWGLVLMLLPATALLLWVVAAPFVNGNIATICFTLGSVAAGCMLYPLFGAARTRGWCAFHDLEEHVPEWQPVNDEVDAIDDRMGSWATVRMPSGELPISRGSSARISAEGRR
eukprot:jgi/Tetstr1/438752/TSEL_027261.t1